MHGLRPFVHAFALDPDLADIFRTAQKENLVQQIFYGNLRIEYRQFGIRRVDVDHLDIPDVVFFQASDRQAQTLSTAGSRIVKCFVGGNA